MGRAGKTECGIAINDQPSGSSAGQQQVLKGLTDCGASDVPMDDRKLKEADILQFPTVVGGYAVVVNLPAIAGGQLRLNGAVLADIFMGDIKLWDDARIANLNPGVSLPKLAISLRGAISVSRKSAVVFAMRASLPHTRHRWAVRRRITVPAMSEAVPSIPFNDHEPAFRLCLAAGYSGGGLGLQIQGRFVLLHPLRRPRQAGRFDVSSSALRGAIFKFRALVHECDRSVSSCASIHLRCHGDLDRDFRRALDAWHADRHFSEYQHPGHLRHMELYRPAAGRYGEPRRRALRTLAIDDRQ